MRKMKKLCAFILSLVMVLSLVPGQAFATNWWESSTGGTTGGQNTNVAPVAMNPGDYTDVQGHWAQDALVNCLLYGLLNGKTKTTVCPDDYITRAEMATLMVRAFEAKKASSLTTFIDMKQADWYYNYVSHAVQMGLLNGNGNAMNPQGNITRQDAAVVFARAFNLYSYKTNIDTYKDAANISGYAQEAMQACVGAGIMGYTGGTNLGGSMYLTRAEFAYMLYSLCQVYVNSAVPYTGGSSIGGSMMVTVPNVYINDTSIGNNLYLGDGVESGTITLSNVNVAGTLYIRGGSRVDITGGSHINTVVVYNPSYAVTVSVDSNSTVGKTVVDTATNAVTLMGNVGDVTMNTSKAILNLVGAKVGKLDASVVLPTVTVDKDSTIDRMDVPADSTGANVTVAGKVKNIVMDADEGTLTVEKSAKITTLDVNGIDATLTLSGAIGDFIISEGSDGNVITIDSTADIEHIELNADGENEITVDGKADIGEFAISKEKADMTLVLGLEQLLIAEEAVRSKIVLDKGTDIDLLTVDADGARVTIKQGANVREIQVNGRDVTIDIEKDVTLEKVNVDGSGVLIQGDGSVEDVTLNKPAVDATVTTPNTTVTNNSTGDATVGTDPENNILEPGQTGITGDDGHMELDEESQKDKEEEEGNGKLEPSAFTMRFAANATATDLYPSGAYTLADMCDNLSFDSASGVLMGGVKQVYGFPPVAGTAAETGYYAPMLIEASDTTDDFTVTILGKVYTKENLSKGQGYNGRIIVFVPLNPLASANSAGRKTVDVTYDADGKKTSFKETTISVEYSRVNFLGDTDSADRAKMLKGAPAIGDTTPVTVSGVTSVSTNMHSATVTHTGLKKTANPSGTEGYWAGLKFVGPKTAATASYVVVANGANKTYNTQLGSEAVGANGAYYTVFNHYEDAQTVKQMTVSITWKNTAGNTIGLTDVYTIDLSQVKCEGLADPNDPGEEDPDPEQPDLGYIANSIEVGKYNASKFQEDYKVPIAAVAQPYNIVTLGDGVGAYAGTYNNYILDNVKGFYLPVNIKVRGLKADANICYGDEGKILASISVATGADQDVLTCIPIPYVGAQAGDIVISLRDKATTNTRREKVFTLYGKEAAVYTSETGISMLTMEPTQKVNNALVSSFVGDGYNVVGSGSNFTVLGHYTKMTVDGKHGWYAPILVSSLNDVSWKVRVSAGGTTKDYPQVSAGTLTTGILVPLGTSETAPIATASYSESVDPGSGMPLWLMSDAQKEEKGLLRTANDATTTADDTPTTPDTRYQTAKVEILDSANKVIATANVALTSAVLDGISDTATETPPTEEEKPEVPVISGSSYFFRPETTVDSSSFSVGGKSFSDLIDDTDSTYSTTVVGAGSLRVSGKAKKIAGATDTSAFAWGAPINVSLSSKVKAKTGEAIVPTYWYVTVTDDAGKVVDGVTAEKISMSIATADVIVPAGKLGADGGADSRIGDCTVSIYVAYDGEAIAAATGDDTATVPEPSIVGSFKVSTASLTLADFTSSGSGSGGGSGSGDPEPEEPATPTKHAELLLQKTGAIGGYSCSSMVSSSTSISIANDDKNTVTINDYVMPITINNSANQFWMLPVMVYNDSTDEACNNWTLRIIYQDGLYNKQYLEMQASTVALVPLGIKGAAGSKQEKDMMFSNIVVELYEGDQRETVDANKCFYRFTIDVKETNLHTFTK